MDLIEQPLTEHLVSIATLVERSLCLWDLPKGARARLINVSENITFMIEAAGGFKAILRVHRENYHSRRAIECELEWIDALAKDQLIMTPHYYLGKDGDGIQDGINNTGKTRQFMVLFHFLEGCAPKEDCDLGRGFVALGEIAAKCHLHVLTWEKSTPFCRLVWDVENVFGTDATWGDWRDAPGVTKDIKLVLEKVERRIRQRLEIYGKAKDRYDLIHADMRLANLLIDGNTISVIDFDDCGYGWFMYDFAAAISFIEDDPRIPTYKAAWLEGYQKHRTLSAEDIAEIDTLVMLRRMALLAWIGSHMEATEPQALAPHFAENTVKLAKTWLLAEGITRFG